MVHLGQLNKKRTKHRPSSAWSRPDSLARGYDGRPTPTGPKRAEPVRAGGPPKQRPGFTGRGRGRLRPPGREAGDVMPYLGAGPAYLDIPGAAPRRVMLCPGGQCRRRPAGAAAPAHRPPGSPRLPRQVFPVGPGGADVLHLQDGALHRALQGVVIGQHGPVGVLPPQQADIHVPVAAVRRRAGRKSSRSHRAQTPYCSVTTPCATRRCSRA